MEDEIREYYERNVYHWIEPMVRRMQIRWRETKRIARIFELVKRVHLCNRMVSRLNRKNDQLWFYRFNNRMQHMAKKNSYRMQDAIKKRKAKKRWVVQRFEQKVLCGKIRHNFCAGIINRFYE